jgi:two-component SAPR family response regulator
MAITLQCIAVDDENLALQLLQAYIAQTAGVHMVAAVTHASELPHLLQQHKIDILFLDIQMPAINGLQLAEQLQNGPMIVFVTAYANHAAEGFRLNAVDYLLKPYSYERFL